MLSLKQRIYLIHWTVFVSITKFNEKFPKTYASRMGVQKLIKKFLKTGLVTNLQKMYSEDLPKSAEEPRQRIINAVASLTIRNSKCYRGHPKVNVFFL
jgi:hypothetical protein